MLLGSPIVSNRNMETCDTKQASQWYNEVCAPTWRCQYKRRPLRDVTVFNLFYNQLILYNVFSTLTSTECQKVQCLDYNFDISLTFSSKNSLQSILSM